MQHVDDSILHAFLDGALDALDAAGALPAGVTPADVAAHLRTCDHCSALLERERELRGEAGVILQHAALDTVDLPPFELVAGHHATGGGAHPRPRRRVLTLAWAASLIVALGAGWWASIVWQDEPAQRASAPASALTESAPGIAADAGDVAALPGAASLHGDVAATAFPSEMSGSTAAVSGAVDASAREAGGSARSEVANAAVALLPPAPVVQAFATPPVDSDAERARELADRIAADASVRATESLRAPLGESVTMSARLPDIVAQRAAVTEEPRVQVSDNAALAVRGTSPLALSTTPASRLGGAPRSLVPNAPPPGRPAARAAAVDTEMPARTLLPVELFRTAVSAARAGALHWQPLAADAALPLVVVDGAARVELSRAAHPPAGDIVRLRHRLADGTALELMQWRDPGATWPLRAADGGPLATVVVSSGETAEGGRELLVRAPALGMYILLSGALDARHLLALADALVLQR